MSSPAPIRTTGTACCSGTWRSGSPPCGRCTAARPTPTRAEAILALKRQLAAGELLGPHLYLAGDLINAVNAVEVGPTFDTAGIAPAIADLKAVGYDFVKFTPHRLPSILYDTIIAGAARVGLKVVGHVPGGKGLGLQRALRDHWTSIEHLTGYFEEVIGIGGKKNVVELYDPNQQDLVDTAAWAQPTFRPDAKQLRDLAVATRRAGVWNCPTLLVLLGNSRGSEEDKENNRLGYLINKRQTAVGVRLADHPGAAGRRGGPAGRTGAGPPGHYRRPTGGPPGAWH